MKTTSSKMKTTSSKMKTTSSKMKTSEKIIRAKKDFIEMGWIGMCLSFHSETPILYNRFIAVLFFGAKIIKTEDGYWWDENDRESRLKYFDLMIRVYKLFGR